MGKNKKKEYQSRNYDQKLMDEIADTLEEYIYLYDMLIIKEGISEKEYEKAMKRIRKAIKDLRDGNGDAVFNKDMYDELIEKRRESSMYE